MRTKFDLKKANLGIGLPVLAAEYTPKGVDVLLQGENGILGIVSYWRANKMKISWPLTPQTNTWFFKFLNLSKKVKTWKKKVISVLIVKLNLSFPALIWLQTYVLFIEFEAFFFEYLCSIDIFT